MISFNLTLWSVTWLQKLSRCYMRIDQTRFCFWQMQSSPHHFQKMQYCPKLCLNLAVSMTKLHKKQKFFFANGVDLETKIGLLLINMRIICPREHTFCISIALLQAGRSLPSSSFIKFILCGLKTLKIYSPKFCIFLHIRGNTDSDIL